MEALQGKVAGLDLTNSSGQAGSTPNFTIRGERSLTASNAPLILVDGIDYGTSLDINPTDIESIEVLKDASSTAIYGTTGCEWYYYDYELKREKKESQKYPLMLLFLLP